MDIKEKEYEIVNRLREHVFGEHGPTQSLLNDGELPKGWAAEYLDLLQVATEQWKHQAMWPRELVAAIHFTSSYLHLRYNAWCSNNNRNRNTERELASLRSPSELFLMFGALETDADAKLPTDAHGVGGRTDFETKAIIADPVILDVI